MRIWSKPDLLALIVMATLVLLVTVRCGTPVCVAGFGQCGTSFTNNNNANAAFALSASPTTTVAGGTVTLTVSPSTNPPYTFNFAAGSLQGGTVGTQQGQCCTGTYNAPTGVVGTAQINATDAVGNTCAALAIPVTAPH